MIDSMQGIIKRILDMSEEIFLAMRPVIPPEWLTSDMTIAQLRVLLLLRTEGPSRMSAIAATLGAALPTITGTMDILVKKELVSRDRDPDDRRSVICQLSQHGLEVMNRMWALGRAQLEKLIIGLSPEELNKSQEIAEILLRNATRGVAGPSMERNTQ
jgi:DNA-binding MarR family transcriptional regulator